MKTMKILVTGGAGFIGSHIVDALIKRGDTVVIVDNFLTGVKKNCNPAATVVDIDITDKKLAEVFVTNQFDAVIHHAAQIDVRKSVADPIQDARDNILGSIQLLELCRQYKTGKVIFASSGGAAYGDTDIVPTPETINPAPISPYGIAKVTIEQYLHYYRVVHGLSSVALRYANVYGPRQNSHGEAGVIAIFSSRLLHGEPAVINGDGTQTRDYVNVHDIVAANLAALDQNVTGAYNIGTGIETTVNQLTTLLAAAFGSPVEFSHGPAKSGEQQRSCLDWSKAKKELGWAPTVGIEQGIADTFAWFKTQA